MSKPTRIYWNPDYQTFEALCENDFILVLRDSSEAENLAEVHGLSVEGN